MANKYQFITEIYERTIITVTNPTNWQNFLRSACRNYKCRFDEQLLIYTQRPDATAVLEIEKWNNQFKRWVNKGASGIAVFDSQNPQSKRLKYYFDVSDTHEGKNAKTVPVWQLHPAYESAVIETLESTYGELENNDTLVAAIINAGRNAAEDNFSDYFSDLKEYTDDSFLYDTGNEYIEKTFKDLIANSVSFMIMERCGINAKDYFTDEDFRPLVDFNTKETLNAVGLATSDIAEMGLREISLTVIALQKENKNNIRTFADIDNGYYNNTEPKNERSLYNERDNLQQSRRLQSAEFDFTGNKQGNSHRQIRDVTQTLSGTEPPSEIYQLVDFLQTDRSFDGNRTASLRDDGNINSSNGENTGRDGTDESDRPNEMGRNDEQYSSFGGGNSADGADIQLGDFLPTVEEQLNMIEEAEVDETSALTISQEDIDLVLQRGSGVENGKYRIYNQLLKNESKAENIKFLREEYGWGGSYPAVMETNLDEGHDGKGIKISRGSISNPDAEILLSWDKVAKRINELITADRYLNDKEKAFLPIHNKNLEITAARVAATAAFNDLIREFSDFCQNVELENPITTYSMVMASGDFCYDKILYQNPQDNKPLVVMKDGLTKITTLDTPYTDRVTEVILLLDNAPNFLDAKTYTPLVEVPKEYQFSLGDKVYIGASRYEIVSLSDDRVMLFDESFPLINKEFLRDDFLQKIKENPSNEHLLREIETPKKQDVTTVQLQKVGDFYEILGEQATDVSEVLNLALTNRISGDERIPMIGFPLFKLEDYSKELQVNGYEMLLPPEEKAPTQAGVGEVDTNIGTLPIEDYREIKATQNGFDSYDDMRSQGISFGNEYDTRPSFPITPAWEQKSKQKVQSYDTHPEIPINSRHQFVIINDELGVGSAREKFRANMDAIKVLKECELQNRFATPDEQKILSKYVGFGSLAKAFEENNSSWANEFKELYLTLSPDEYAAAKESTLTAFYTPPVVIRSMYKALANMGFSKGNILEPSCGTGNFIGMLPKTMADSKIYGVELDNITGRIAQQLYQKSSIAVEGFEKTILPDSFFDVAIGNVPFGQFKVIDKKYDKLNFLIHDYFFGRTLDKVRPGGVVAFITSKGTMDKENSSVRKYLAQRADLIGAIRLPNNTFTKNAGTEVTSDIIFLQKRDRIIDIESDWVRLGVDENGLRLNQYFIDHPEMVLGEMKEISGPYGPETACVAYDDQTLEDLLSNAISNIHAEFSEYETDELAEDETDNSIPADPTVRNFSYALVDGKIYFRENSRMSPVDVSATAESRIKGMIGIRNSVRNLIEMQTEDYPDSDIKEEQLNLNNIYDDFTKKYGLLGGSANSTAFSNDSSYCLLTSLEIVDENGNLERKADMFTKRTIKPHIVIEKVDTASEALAVSLAEKACVDMFYMSQLTDISIEDLEAELTGVIFRIPTPSNSDGNPIYQTADEYLSGNVREKLLAAKMAAEISSIYDINVEALEKVQPTDLSPGEISVRLGATWLPPEVVQKFMFELLDTPRYAQWNIKVHYSTHTSEWNVEGKNYDRGNVKAINTYGSSRINAYKIIEETLNLKDVRIFDYVEDAEGRKTAVLNKKETAIAQAKQEQIKAEFADWIWKEPARRETLTKMYNEKFNSIRPREYDGNHITFSGINPEIFLREHQVNAIAHILYGGNTLLAHVVGAGKTFEMVAAAMESKRLGLCNKSLFVVPNHLTEQWASEFLQLYPSANILVAAKKDFETKNRKKFCGRIATGDYDAVIIGHSQFEKIPMSIERQRAILEEQLDDILSGISDSKRNKAENFTIKQLMKTQKNIEAKLAKLNDQSRKDDVVTFEELGVDRLFIDESHYYKNLFLYTKMRNVGGIAQTEAQKSSDLFMKCRYLDELTGGRGVVFATGTPISNSMVEMYTIQRYLQYKTLQKNGLQHFDSWASTFGETVTAIELAPEGTGYRAKTRFAKFYNLPELMAMFKEVADIQTADMLNLPVPIANYHNVSVKPSEIQVQLVEELSQRADKVRNRMVDASIDNMLKITNDGRKLALDQRLINDMLPDYEGSKINACAQNVYEIWNKSTDKKSAQLIFCDLSTPKGDDTFSVYTDIRDKLIARGMPIDEIQFIHDADTEAKKKELFIKVRKGDVRVLLGSTAKMGAGTNVQEKLIALHDADCPWRPSDLEQRSGRIIRQGNKNPEVEIFRYVTEQTFDAYLYQLVENKQKFISQIMTSKSPVRSAEDIDETALSYAEIKMLATGNPHIKEKMDLDIGVAKLKLLKQSHLSARYSLEDKILKHFPKEIKYLEERIVGLEKDIFTAKQNTPKGDDKFLPIKIGDVTHAEKAQAGEAILAACKAKTKPEATPLGEYRGFEMSLEFDTFSREYKINLKGEISHKVTLGNDVHGNITRIDNVLDGLDSKLTAANELLDNTKTQFTNAEVEVKREFPQEAELKAKTARLDELNIVLNIDKRENEMVDGDIENAQETPEKVKNKSYER